MGKRRFLPNRRELQQHISGAFDDESNEDEFHSNSKRYFLKSKRYFLNSKRHDERREEVRPKLVRSLRAYSFCLGMNAHRSSSSVASADTISCDRM